MTVQVYPTDRQADYIRATDNAAQDADNAARIVQGWIPRNKLRRLEEEAGAAGDMDAWEGKPKANPFNEKTQPVQWLAYEDGFNAYTKEN